MLPSYAAPLSLSQINTEFLGPGGTISLGGLRAGWGIVPNGTIGYPYGYATAIPTAGSISIGNFHGAQRREIIRITSTGGWTSPLTGYISMILVGGGGAGGCGGGDEGGGGGGAGGVLYQQWIWVQKGLTYWIHIGRGASRPISSRFGGRNSMRGGGLDYWGYCIDHAEPSTAFGYTAVRGGNGGFRELVTLSMNRAAGVEVDDTYRPYNVMGYCEFGLLPQRTEGPGGDILVFTPGPNLTNPHAISTNTKRGWEGGSGGGATGRGYTENGSAGTSGQGHQGGAAVEEGDAGGGGGAGGAGWAGGAGAGRTFNFDGTVIEVGGGGAPGPGWWSPSFIPGGVGGGGGKDKWQPSGDGVPNTGGGGAGGSAGNWADAGPYKGGGGGGSGVCYILIGYN